MTYLKHSIGLLVLLTSCSLAATAAPADWTVMIYMAADNNLEDAALIDLDEIEAGMPEQGVEIIVLIDRAKEYTESLGNWTDARILRMRPNQERGTLASEEIKRLGEINTGDPRNLEKFIQYSVGNYPAKRYGLVMWDHGGGWQGMADDEDAGDGQSHDNLSLPELRKALSSAIPQGRKLDFIGFDMCLMAQVEIAYEVADFARFMVASQAVEPGYGWPYDVLLPAFAESTAGPKRLAQNIVRRYGEHTEQAGERVATQSAIDLSKIEQVKGAIDALTNRIGPTARQNWTSLTRSIFWADSFNPQGKDTNRKQAQQALSSSDLLDLVKRSRVILGEQFPAQAEFQQLVDAMDGAVVDSRNSLRHRLSHGLSIYAPPSAATYNPAYEQTRFGASSSWPRLLKAVHRHQGSQSAAPTINYFQYVDASNGQQRKTTSMLDNTTLRLKVQGNNLLWVQSLTGRYSAEDKGHLILSRGYMSDSRFLEEKLAASGDAAELLVPVFKGNTATLEMEVMPATYTISNGETYGFATLDASEAQLGEGQSVAILAEFENGELGRHQAVISFNLMTWKADGIALLVEMKDGRVVPRGVKPQATDKITLLYEFIPDGEQEPSLRRGVQMPWKNGLELIMSEVPNGDYTTWAIAENLSGETHVARTTVRGVAPQWEVAAGFDGARKLTIENLSGVWASVDDDTPIFAIGQALGKGLAALVTDKEALPAEAKDWKFLVELDNRLLPMLSILTFDASGEKLLGRIPYMILADPTQPDSLWIKSLIGGGGQAVGEIVQVRRTQRLAEANKPKPTGGGGASQDDSNAPDDDDIPAVKPPTRVRVVGAWAGQGQGGVEVYVELMRDGTFQQMEVSYAAGLQVETWGSYDYRDNTMTVRFAGGRQCHAYGCEPFAPAPIAPFPLEVRNDVMRSPWAVLYRQDE
ncbi:MAG: clostripain-related cysteine peptidase [Pseudomonadota bacterium]